MDTVYETGADLRMNETARMMIVCAVGLGLSVLFWVPIMSGDEFELSMYYSLSIIMWYLFGLFVCTASYVLISNSSGIFNPDENS